MENGIYAYYNIREIKENGEIEVKRIKSKVEIDEDIKPCKKRIRSEITQKIQDLPKRHISNLYIREYRNKE